MFSKKQKETENRKIFLVTSKWFPANTVVLLNYKTLNSCHKFNDNHGSACSLMVGKGSLLRPYNINKSFADYHPLAHPPIYPTPLNTTTL